MSGVGFWELILLFLIGLIVLGPERLPRVANQLGSWLGQARRMTRVMKRQLEEELNLEKDFSIRPQPAAKALPQQPHVKPRPVDDATPSPPQDADRPGTGADAAPHSSGDTFSDTDVLPELPADAAEVPQEEGSAATGTARKP